MLLAHRDFFILSVTLSVACAANILRRYQGTAKTHVPGVVLLLYLNKSYEVQVI